MDILSEAEEAAWCAKQREDVVAYLARQGLDAPDVGDWPAWHIAPVVAVWAIESKEWPGWIGWWAISGDLPTDYATCRGERHPRQALVDIGERWKIASAHWSRGERCGTMELSTVEQERALAPMLAVRAQLLLDFASDDRIWRD